MQQVKFFKRDSGYGLEDSINQWLKENPTYKIQNIQYQYDSKHKAIVVYEVNNEDKN